jgi:hypothetical protein
MNNFDVYLIDGSANVKKVNVAPVAAGAGTGSFTWVVNASAAPLTGPGAGFTVKVVETTKLFQGISGAFTISGPMSITTTSPIASATQNVAYAGVTFTASGGAGGYTWTATNIPPGMNLAAGGLLNGTPTSNGTFNMVVTVTDSAAATVNKTIRIVVAPAPGALALAFASIPNPKTGVPYSFTATATGGTAPYTWAATGLPAGLTINAATGVISGTPTGLVGSVSTVQITVTDSVPTSLSSPVLTVTVVSATAASGGKKGGCEIGGLSSDWTAFLFVLALASAAMGAVRLTRKNAIA